MPRELKLMINDKQVEDFCIAYKGILSKHEVYATGTTGRRIEEVTNLRIHKFLAGSLGGDKQFIDMIEIIYSLRSYRHIVVLSLVIEDTS